MPSDVQPTEVTTAQGDMSVVGRSMEDVGHVVTTERPQVVLSPPKGVHVPEDLSMVPPETKVMGAGVPAFDTALGDAGGAASVEVEGRQLGSATPCPLAGLSRKRVCFSSGLPRLEWPDHRDMDMTPFVLNDLEVERVISGYNMKVVTMDKLMGSSMATMDQALHSSMATLNEAMCSYMATMDQARSELRDSSDSQVVCCLALIVYFRHLFLLLTSLFLQYMAEQTMAKSLCLHRQKEDWDRLTAEAAALRAREEKARQRAERLENELDGALGQAAILERQMAIEREKAEARILTLESEAAALRAREEEARQRAERLDKECDGALGRADVLERQMAVEQKKREEAGACILTLESEAASHYRQIEWLRSTNNGKAFPPSRPLPDLE